MLTPDEVVYENRLGMESVKICFHDDVDDNVVTVRISLSDGMELVRSLKAQCGIVARENRRKKG